MQAIRQMVMDSGMGGGTTEHPTLLYTADGGVQQPDGSLPDLPAHSRREIALRAIPSRHLISGSRAAIR